jgi:hypothetical protein
VNTRVCEERFRTRYAVKELKDLEGRLAALAGTREATRSCGGEGRPDSRPVVAAGGHLRGREGLPHQSQVAGHVSVLGSTY